MTTRQNSKARKTVLKPAEIDRRIRIHCLQITHDHLGYSGDPFSRKMALVQILKNAPLQRSCSTGITETNEVNTLNAVFHLLRTMTGPIWGAIPAIVVFVWLCLLWALAVAREKCCWLFLNLANIAFFVISITS